MQMWNSRIGLLMLGLCWLTRPASAATQPAGPGANSRHALAAFRQQAAPTQPRSAGIHWTFRDIDIQTLLGRLKRFGVELPLPATGRVTVRLSISAPWRSILRAGSYEVDGDLTSPALNVAGIELKKLTLHLQYKEGALDLSAMRFTVPGNAGAEGVISGTARMLVQPPGDLHANLAIEKLPLSALAGTLPALAGQLSGEVSGRFNGQAPANRLRDLAAWHAEGRLTLANLVAFGLPAAEATTELRLSQGQATLTQLTAQLEDARLAASAQLSLTAPYAFTSRLRATIPDLNSLNRLKADFQPPVAIAGSFSLSADANGQLAPKRVRLRGSLDGRNLKAHQLTIDRLLIPYDGTLNSIRVRNLRLDLYGGRISANLNLPTTRGGNLGAGLRIENVDLARAASDLLNQKQSWRGAASGSLQLLAPAARLTQLDAWSGQGRLTFGRGAISGIDVSSIETRLQIAKGRLNLSNVLLDSAFARITGSAQADLVAPFGFSTALRIAEVDFAQLNRLPETFRPPVTVGGRAGISLRAQGTLQPFDFAARGGVATRRLRADRFFFDSLNFNYRISPQTMALSQVAGALYGGRVDGSATLGLTAPYDFGLKLNVTNADLAIANSLQDTLRRLANVAGRGNFSADLNGQLDPLSIQGQGQVRARDLRIDRARFDSLTFGFSAEKDLVKVPDLALIAYRGRLDGQIAMPLNANNAAAIDLRWQQINVGALLTDLRGVATNAVATQAGSETLTDLLNQTQFAGWTWGSLSVQTPAGKFFEPAAWTGKVDIALAALRLFGWSAKKGFVKGSLAGGRADLSRLAFDLDGTRLLGAARLNLSQPYDFNSRFSLDKLQLADFNALPEAIRPPVKLSGTVSVSAAARGTLDPLEITGTGSVTGNDLQADGARLDHLAIRFDAEKDRLALNRFQADLYGGQITGDAKLALRGEGSGHVNFNWRNINLGQLITDVAKLPVTVRGTLAGRLKIDIPDGKLADPLSWDVAAQFDTSPLGTRSEQLAELHGRLAYNDQLLDYHLDGELLRGAVDLAGRWQLRQSAPTAALPLPLGEGRGEGAPPRSSINEGHFQLRNARLDALTPLVGMEGALDSFTGTLGAEVEYRHEKSGLPAGAGQVTIDDLRLGGGDLLDELRGRILVAADRVEITNVDAALGGGSLNLSGLVYLDPRRRGSFRLKVNGADLAQLLAPWPQIASKTRGIVDAQLQGFFGGRRPVIVAGTIALARGHAAGIDISGVRVPVNGSIDPLSGRGTLELHGLTGQIAHGRITGNFDVTLADGIGLAGRGRLADIDLRTLLQHSGSAGRMASGKISGDYTLAGRNIRTINDLTGTLDATLRDAQAMSLPVLERTIPYLTGGVSGATTFDEGAIRASLARGMIRVERFSLASGSAQIYAEGKVTLAGRLNLNVTINTGQLSVPRRTLSMLASRILLVAAPPVGVLLNVTQFLSNQVINLEVTGTVRAPTVRIRPLNLLGQEAAQFFLLRALP